MNSSEATKEQAWNNEVAFTLCALDRDQLLMMHQQIKDELAALKEREMNLRKYIVKRAFPEAKEGTNTLELGNGYQLKAGIKFNYKLMDNDVVEKCLDKIKTIGNTGAFIADRLVSWTPHFLVTEYRTLQEEANSGSIEAKAILREVNEMLIIDDAAPTLEIKAPKGSKK